MSDERKLVKISLIQSGVSGLVELNTEGAPQISSMVWEALPLEGPTFHAKYANHEVYTLVPPLVPQDEEPEPEALTVFPIPGDICYFRLPGRTPVPKPVRDQFRNGGSVDLALFYGRDNYLLGSAGHNPATVLGSVVSGLDELAGACESLFLKGTEGERLRFDRA